MNWIILCFILYQERIPESPSPAPSLEENHHPGSQTSSHPSSSVSSSPSQMDHHSERMGEWPETSNWETVLQAIPYPTTLTRERSWRIWHFFHINGFWSNHGFWINRGNSGTCQNMFSLKGLSLLWPSISWDW